MFFSVLHELLTKYNRYVGVHLLSICFTFLYVGNSSAFQCYALLLVMIIVKIKEKKIIFSDRNTLRSVL